MALSDELAALIDHAGRGVLDDASTFGAALDDYLSPETADRGVINLLVDAVRQGAVARLLRDIDHGGDPARAVETCGDQLARDRATSESASSRWAVAVLGHAAGVVPPEVLGRQTPPRSLGTAAAPPVPPPVPPSGPPPTSPPTSPPAPPSAPPSAPSPAHPTAGRPPTVAAPAPQGWPTPPNGPSGAASGRRTGLVVGSIAAIVVLVGGGVLAGILLSGDDEPAPESRDRGSSAATGATGTAGPSDPTSVTTSGGPATSPALIEADLAATASHFFPAESTPEITASSWSVDLSNVPDGYPRDLAPSEREEATSWAARTADEGHRFGITVDHVPPDAVDEFAVNCVGFTPTDDSDVECEEFTTSEGRAAIEYWFRHPGGSIASHQVVIEGDFTSGTPQLTIGEWIDEPAAGLTIEQMKQQVQFDRDYLVEVAEDERLMIPRPSSEPSLPSYDYCFAQTDPPASCPSVLY